MALRRPVSHSGPSHPIRPLDSEARCIVNAIRDLLTPQPVGTDVWIALAWLVGILTVAYAFAMVTHRRKIA